MKTQLEHYLEFIIKEDSILDKESFIRENDLNNPKRLNRFKIKNWVLYPLIIVIPLGMFASETNNKYLLLVSLIIGLSLFISSIIALKINGTYNDIEENWVKKEWEKYTGIPYRRTQINAFGSYSSLMEIYVLEEERQILKRLDGKPEEYQKKFLRRALGTDGF